MPELTSTDFAWDGYFWTATVRLSTWQGFQSRRGAYGFKDTDHPSDGSVALIFAPEGRDESPLIESELRLVRWAVQHAQEMQRSLLEKLLLEYPAIQKKYRGFAHVNDLPPVQSADDFKTIIGLHGVNIHPIEHEGLPYVGLEFGCSWDCEHGLGVLMHGTRVVEIGGADTAILLWIAEKDAGIES
jgi:hypothetical protein